MSKPKLIRVRDIMKDNFLKINGLKTVQEAIDSLRQADAHTLIVEKRHENDEYGIVVLADIAKNVLAKDRAPERVNVYEIMSKPVLCVDPDMDIRYCSRLFDRFGLSTAPVIQKGQVIGIITYQEIVLHGLCSTSSQH